MRQFAQSWFQYFYNMPTVKGVIDAAQSFFELPRDEIFHLKVGIEYYNQKYSERGTIYHISANVKNDSSFVIQRMKELRKENDGHPVKIIITDYPHIHSHPFILTKDKLISLRDNQYFSADTSVMDVIEKGLNASLINQKNTPTSIQGDGKSCHFIALAIMKDVTQEDLEMISQFDDQYEPPAKFLKYSQSLGHIISNSATLDPVKKDGTTAASYVTQYKSNGKEKGMITRISTKKEEFEKDCDEVLKDNPSTLPKVVAARVLKLRSKKQIDPK